MILGVVLGNIAELNLARCLAITTDLTPFVTRPWALFFLIIAVFSALFPVFSAHRGSKAWASFYPSALAASVARMTVTVATGIASLILLPSETNRPGVSASETYHFIVNPFNGSTI